MKIKTLTILLSFLFIGLTFSQTHTISYTFFIEGCDNNPNLELFSGSMLEGENMTFNQYTLPQGNSDSQFFYDLMVGGELGFPIGSLKENIHCDIVLSGLCGFDPSNILPEDNLLKLLFLNINVTGEKSGVHGSTDYYYLENNKESYIRLPLQKLKTFLYYLTYTIDDFTPFYVNSQSSPDYEGIRKSEEENFLSIYSRHFSTIGVGFKVDTPTDVSSTSVTPEEYGLAQNYPNPFNPTTTINYTLPNSGFAKLSVFNAIGQEVQTLVNENQQSGNYSVNFNADDLPSGLYFYTLSSGKFTQTNKMILMK